MERLWLIPRSASRPRSQACTVIYLLPGWSLGGLPLGPRWHRGLARDRGLIVVHRRLICSRVRRGKRGARTEVEGGNGRQEGPPDRLQSSFARRDCKWRVTVTVLVNWDSYTFECRLKMFSCLSSELLGWQLAETHGRFSTPTAAMSGVAYVDVKQTYYGDLLVVAHIIPPSCFSWCITWSVDAVCVCVCVYVCGGRQRHREGERRHTVIEDGCLLQYIRKHYGSLSRASMMKEQHRQEGNAHTHICTSTPSNHCAQSHS